MSGGSRIYPGNFKKWYELLVSAFSASGNVKTSIAEFESDVSTDNNTQLNVAPYLVDEFGDYAQMLTDGIFQGAPVVIDSEHHEIHCGDSYTTHFLKDVPNAGTSEVLIVVPTETGTGQSLKRYHAVITASSESEADYEFYESPTVTDNGTALGVYNRERDSSLTSGLSIYHTPTTSADGTNIDGDHWGSGRGSGGGGERRNEWVLGNGKTYLIRITNSTTTANHCVIRVDHYVHPGI